MASPTAPSTTTTTTTTDDDTSTTRTTPAQLFAQGDSRIGTLHQDFGDPNQDNYFMLDVPPIFMCGVFDGHGDQGEDVADVLCRACYYGFEEALAQLPTAPAELEAFLRHHFEIAVAQTMSQSIAESSGTTATIILIDYRAESSVLLACLTVGDSSAVAVAIEDIEASGATSASSSSSVPPRIVTLSAQHRTSVESERLRIQVAGGLLEGQFVVHPTDEPPQRVIAITRSVGDKEMHIAGINAEPDVSLTTLPLSQGHHIGVLAATDGLWDNLHFDGVVEALRQHQLSCDADAALQYLYRRLAAPTRARIAASPPVELYAHAAGDSDEEYTPLGEESSGVEDDCTMIVAFIRREPRS